MPPQSLPPGHSFSRPWVAEGGRGVASSFPLPTEVRRRYTGYPLKENGAKRRKRKGA